jgi:RNA polymerase sigma-70 factor (ECF subfamily)
LADRSTPYGARSNEERIAALSQSGPRYDAALQDLRTLLVRGLGYALASHSNVRESDLEDFAQNALLKVLHGLHTFRGESRFITWAQKIAVRVAYTELRRRWRDVSLDELTKPKEGDGEFIPVDLANPSVGPEQQAMQRTILETLRRLIHEELTDKQRQALQAMLAGMPLEEIAHRAGTNRNAYPHSPRKAGSLAPPDGRRAGARHYDGPPR